jgi:hypothetical protein
MYSLKTNLGLSYQNLKNHKQAVLCFQTILEILKENEVRERIKAINYLGKVY